LHLYAQLSFSRWLVATNWKFEVQASLTKGMALSTVLYRKIVAIMIWLKVIVFPYPISSRIYNIAFFLHILIISQNNSNNKSFVYSVSNCQNMWFPCGATMKIESIVEEETTHLHSQTYIYYSFLLTRGYNKLYKILLLLIAAEIILSSSSTIFGCLRCVKIKLEQYANVAADKWVYI